MSNYYLKFGDVTGWWLNTKSIYGKKMCALGKKKNIKMLKKMFWVLKFNKLNLYEGNLDRIQHLRWMNES